MSTETIAGHTPRTTMEEPSGEKSGVCDLCGERAAVGVMADGRDVCRPCARREPVMDSATPVQPQAGDTVLFEFEGVEVAGEVVQRADDRLTVDLTRTEEIDVAQVVEIVEGGGA